MSVVSSSILSRLVPMLGSTHDGEVVAAARAIERKLKGDGRDWHWIAEQVASADWVASLVADGYRTKPAAPPAPQPHPEYRPRKSRDRVRPEPQYDPKPINIGWNEFSHHARIEWINLLAWVDWLTPAEKEIVGRVRGYLHEGTAFDLKRETKKVINRLIKKATDMGVTP